MKQGSDDERAALRDVRQRLLEASRRHSRVPHEAEDLAHDILLAALRRGLPLTDGAFLRRAHGSARLHGAFLARSAQRRRARELRAVAELFHDPHGESHDEDAPLPPPQRLSAALQTTLSLLVLGLDKAEVRFALGLTDAALRKRFQALRQLAPLARPTLRGCTRTLVLTRLRRSQVELLPRLATRAARDGRPGRVLAVGDPDGHGLIFAEVLTPGGRAATTAAPTPNSRAPEKGPPCSTASSRTSPSSST